MDRILNVQLNTGQEPKTNPTTEAELKEIYFQNMNDVLSLIFYESDATFEELRPLEDQRVDAIKSFPTDSPWKSFLTAEIKLQWAFLKLKYGSEWGAFWSLKSASKSIEENNEEYPNFILNNRTSGLLNILFGITPDKYKWVFKLFGMQGAVSSGIEQLEAIEENDSLFGLETNIILGMIYSHLLEDFGTNRELIDQHPFGSSPLASYFHGIILQKSHQSEKARELWQSNSAKIPFKTYLIAESYFQQGNYIKATTSFKEFLSEFLGLTYKKDAYLKLALSSKFQGDLEGFSNNLSMAKNSEANSTEIDQNAQKIIDSIEKINYKMLQLRFAIDGGYYQQAEALISKIKSQNLGELEQIELEYRKARLAHSSGQTREAIKHYRSVISSSQLIKGTYFAPNSYLQLGYLERDLGNFKEAINYFEQVLSYKDHPYKASLDSKAKVAISLLGDSND